MHCIITIVYDIQVPTQKKSKNEQYGVVMMVVLLVTEDDYATSLFFYCVCFVAVNSFQRWEIR